MDKTTYTNPHLESLNQTFSERFGEAEFEAAKRKARFKLALAKTIRERRKAKRIGQKSLARRLGTTQQQLSKYETGTNDPTVDRLYELCENLDLEISISDKANGRVLTKT